MKLRPLFFTTVFTSLIPVAGAADHTGRRVREHEALRVAMQECMENYGLEKSAPGSPPSEEDRVMLDECMTSKAVVHPGRRIAGSLD